MGRQEKIKYLGGEVEITASFFPDVEGNERLESLKSIDLTFVTGKSIHNIHVSVREVSGAYVGDILAGPKEIEFLFSLAENVE